MDARIKEFKARSFKMNVVRTVALIIMIAVTSVCFTNIINPDSCGIIDKIFYSGVLVVCALLIVSILAVINLSIAALSLLFPPHIGPVVDSKKKYIKVSFNIFVKAMYYFMTISTVILAFGIIWAPGKLIGVFG